MRARSLARPSSIRLLTSAGAVAYVKWHIIRVGEIAIGFFNGYFIETILPTSR